MNLPQLPSIATLLLAATLTATAQVDVPTLVNYQGFVTDSNADPLGDGTATNYDVVFAIYDAATAGTTLWAEMQTVTILDGQFSVLLGNGVALPGQTDPHPDLGDLFAPGPVTSESVYLGVTVNTIGQTTEPELAPRQQLVANPFALHALNADVAQAVAPGGVAATALAQGSISGGANGAIADGSVTADDLADNTITGAQLANSSVSATQIASNAITRTQLANDSVHPEHISDSAVLSRAIFNNSILSEDIRNETIIFRDIADETITGTQIANNSITSNEIVFADGLNDILILGAPNHLDPVQDNTFQISNEAAPSTQVDFPFRFRHGRKGWGNAGIGYTPDGFLAFIRRIGDPGYATLNNNGGFASSSDERIKKDITPARDMLEKALAISPVRYRFKAGEPDQAQQLGFTAQDVAEQLPELVNKDEIWTLNYAGLSTVAIGAIQEQHKHIESLQKQNDALKARLDRLEKALLTK